MQETHQIFFDPEVKQLIDSFSYCFGVKITLYSPLVEEWVVGVFLKSSDYCTMLQKGLGVRTRCLAQDKLMCERCKRLGKMTVYRCHGGLNEAVMPIQRDGLELGYAMLGQFRTEKQIPASLLSTWEEAGLDVASFVSAFENRPHFEAEKLKRMLHLFSRLISFIVSSSFVKVGRAQLVEQVIQYLDDHMEEMSNLSMVAKAVDRSESTVSHAIKQRFGVSFKTLATMRKIQRFESILNKYPHLSIKEASCQVGFSDQLYFSRLYRKYRSSSPTQYMQTLLSKDLGDSLMF